MPVLKSAAPVLLSGSVAGVTSYGCYSHISNSSLDGSVGNGKEGLPPLNVEERPQEEGESDLEPNAANTGDSVAVIDKAEGANSQTVDTKEETGNSTDTNPSSGTAVVEKKKNEACSSWYS